MENSITPQQSAVIDSLISGMSKTDAALAAGCDRQSIHRWLRSDVDFVAELNRRRLAVQDENREKLRALGGRAVAVLERCLNSADESIQLRAATHILKSLGMDSIDPIERSDNDPEVVASKQSILALGDTLNRLRAAHSIEQPQEKMRRMAA